MQSNPGSGYQPSRPNPFDDRGPSDYDSKANSTTNLTAGAPPAAGAGGDAMSQFYSEVRYTLIRLQNSALHGLFLV